MDDGKETKHVPAHSKEGHMEVQRWLKIEAHCFDKLFGLNFFPRINIHAVPITVVDDLLLLFFVSTAISALVFTTSCTKHHMYHTVDNERAKH